MNGDDSRIVKDPICGRDVDTLRARAVGIFGGVTYYFCSAECKAKYVDPRRAPRVEPSAVSGQPSAPERKQPEKKQNKKAQASDERADQGGERELLLPGDEPVRYARSRIRRITGEVGTPVVQIDLSPNSRSAPSTSGVRDAEPLPPPSSSARTWIVLAVVMLIIAGGVILFTLNHR